MTEKDYTFSNGPKYYVTSFVNSVVFATKVLAVLVSFRHPEKKCTKMGLCRPLD